MTKEHYITMIIAASVGILFQLLYKAYKLQQKARLANLSFNIWQWAKDDAIILTINILSPYVVVYLFDEFAFDGDPNELLIKWIKTLFVFVGFTGSSVLMGIFSVADKKFNKVIDTKTNLADFGSEEKPKN